MRINPGLERFVKENGSTILTFVGAAGVIGTSVLTYKASTKASVILQEAETNKGESLTFLEKVQVAGPTYIPSILMGAGTIACIIGSNVLNKQKQAALTSAYMLLDQSFKEYKHKVVEMYGEEVDDSIEESIKQDHIKPRR